MTTSKNIHQSSQFFTTLGQLLKTIPLPNCPPPHCPPPSGPGEVITWRRSPALPIWEIGGPPGQAGAASFIHQSPPHQRGQFVRENLWVA